MKLFNINYHYEIQGGRGLCQKMPEKERVQSVRSCPWISIRPAYNLWRELREVVSQSATLATIEAAQSDKPTFATGWLTSGTSILHLERVLKLSAPAHGSFRQVVISWIPHWDLPFQMLCKWRHLRWALHLTDAWLAQARPLSLYRSIYTYIYVVCTNWKYLHFF